MGDYLNKHGSGWRYMRAVPKDLKPVIGKAYLLRTIGAMPHAEAKARAQKFAAEDADLFSRLKRLSPTERLEIVRAGGVDSWQASHEIDIRLLPFLEVPKGDDFDPDAPEEMQAQQAFEVAKWRKDFAATTERVGQAKKLKIKIKGQRPSDQAQLMRLITLYQRERPAVDKRSFNRARLYICRLINHVGDMQPKQLTRDHILKLRDALEAEGYSKVNINQHLDKLGTVFSIAMNCGEMDINPADRIRARETSDKKTSRRKGFTEAEMKAIFAARVAKSEDFALMIKMLAYHGMRSGELVQVCCSDIVTEHGVLVVSLHDEGEGRTIKNTPSVRQVPIHPHCRDEVLALVKRVTAAHGPNALLFQSVSRHDAPRRFQEETGDWLRSLGLKDRRPHDFRHRFRTVCGEAEMPERFSRALMGHTLGKDVHGAYGEAPSLKARLRWLSKVDPISG